MIKKKESLPPTIDTTGPEGNAFSLLAYAENFSKQLNFSNETELKIQEEMKSGDYESLIETFDKYFGEFVIMLR
jgi:hypothetical protein